MYFGCRVNTPGNAVCSDGSPITLGNDVLISGSDASDCYQWDRDLDVKPYDCGSSVGGVCESPLSKAH